MNIDSHSLSHLFLTALLLFSISANAHEVRPALLTLTETAQDQWQATFKQPQVQGRFLNLSVKTNCSASKPIRLVGIAALQETRELNCTSPLSQIKIDGLDRTLIDTMVTMTNLEGKKTTFLISAAEPQLDLTDTTPNVPVYLMLGIEHLLFGIDHVLFVLMLLYLVKGWRNLIKVVTSFTLAHSITLGLATTGMVTVSQLPVEALIALSIALLAREALQSSRSLIAKRPWLMAFAFGLLHGLGFAGALKDIGLPDGSLISALLLFNIGIELGQLGVVALALLLMPLLKKSIQQMNLQAGQFIATAPVYMIGAVASFWFIERTLFVLS